MQSALDEFSTLGRTAFLARYGFGKSRDFLVPNPANGELPGTDGSGLGLLCRYGNVRHQLTCSTARHSSGVGKLAGSILMALRWTATYPYTNARNPDGLGVIQYDSPKFMPEAPKMTKVNTKRGAGRTILRIYAVD